MSALTLMRVRGYIFRVSIQQEIEKLEARKAANLKLIKKYESAKNLRGKISESNLQRIAELRQANEGYEETMRWLRREQWG
jgi:hypothetical protein